MSLKYQSFDPNQVSIENIDNTIEWLLSSNEKYQLTGTKIVFSSRRLAINLFVIHILNKYGLKIRKKYLFTDKILDDKIYSTFTNIYNDLIESINDDDRFYSEIYQNIKWDFWYGFNWINNFALKYCKRHISTLDIQNVVKTYRHPKIQKIINAPINKMLSIYNIEKELDINRKKLLHILETLDIPENQLKLFIELNTVNKGQVGHFLYKIGYRSDVDDTTIPKLVENNYLNGIRDNLDFILESLADKKSRLYNKLLMSGCQYNNRTNQLAIYSIQRVYHNDCQTPHTVDFLVTETNYDKIVGKYYLDDDGNLNHIKSKEDSIKLIDQIIQLRSPITCRYSDGVCSICGGTIISRYIQKGFNLGNSIMTEYYQGTAQKVLSSKHFQIVETKEYNVPDELKYIFRKRKKRIYFQKNIKMKGLALGLQVRSCKALLNISDSITVPEDEIYEHNFGKYRYISIRQDNEILSSNVSMEFLKRYPMLSKPFIQYIFKIHKKFDVDQDIIWIPLDDYDPSKHIFTISAINYSIKVYYDRLKEFIEKQIGKYNNPSTLLQDFSDIVFERSDINIVYLETIIKGFLVKNKIDMTNVSYDVNKNNLTFGTLKQIVKYRNIGSALAFQGHQSFLRDPLFYLVPRGLSPFDYFLNFNTNEKELV